MPKIVCRAALVMLISIVGGGCYESAVPLDALPRTALDPKLLGTWRCVTSHLDDQTLTMIVGRGRDGVYAVSVQESGDTPDKYEAHGSVVAGETLLNIRDLKDPAGPASKPWVFARAVLLQPNTLQVQVVSDRVLKGVDASAAAVRRAIEGRRKDPGLFDDVFTCVRAKAGQ